MKKIGFLTVCVTLLSGRAAAQSTPPAGRTAGQAMKNVVVLKDIPEFELNPTMTFIATSLGVACTYCHTEAFDSDMKKPKLTARAMIRMTMEINAANFGGRSVINCNTCHQGSVHPKGGLSLWSKAAPAAPPAPPSAKPAEVLPDLDRVLASYRKAVGGDGVKSVHAVGTMVGESGPSRALDSYAVFPDKFVIGFSFSGIDAKLVLNRDRGWTISPQGRFDFPPDRLVQVRETMAMFEPVKFITLDLPRKVTGMEKVGDRDCVIVESQTGKDFRRLFFDAQTGLLHKVRVEARTSLGVVPSEIVFDDYRDVNGVKMPWSIVIHAVNDRLVYKFSEIQINPAVDPAKFEPPPATTK
jgi:hypothetical protein